MIHHQDCLEHLKTIQDNTISAVITDPPYNLGDFMKGRAHNLGNMRENNFVDAGWDNGKRSEWESLMSQTLSELSRVLKPKGSLIVFMSVIKVETFIALAQQAGFYYKTTGIWHKTNPMPRNMNLHYINSTESWIYFTNKSRTGTFNNDGKAIHDFIETGLTPAKEKRHGKHPTQKPLEVMRHFVETLTPQPTTPRLGPTRTRAPERTRAHTPGPAGSNPAGSTTTHNTHIEQQEQRVMTSTEPKTTTIEALDFTPGCDAKGGSEIKPSEGNCEHPAEFSAHVHACQPDHPPILLVCKEHLHAGITYYTRRIRLVTKIHQKPRCSECGLEIQSVEDLIWDVQPIK